ncbi:MAG: endo-1,4-beta-xylanase [Bryobacteraceae bacterium]
MKNIGLFSISISLLAGALGAQQLPQPHVGWKLVPGGEDLIASGYWDQNFFAGATPAEFQIADGVVTATAVNGYECGPNMVAPRLVTTGDFGVLVTLQTAPGQVGCINLTGQLTTSASAGTQWQGRKMMQIGVEPGGAWSLGYWMGGQANADFYQWLKSFSAPQTGTFTIELLRQSGQFYAYFNGTQFGPFADPGLFSNGFVIPGFNVAPGNKMVFSQYAFEVPASDSAATVYTPVSSLAFHAGDSLGSLAAASGRTFGVAFTNPASIAEGFSNTVAATPDLTYAPKLLGEFNQLVNATMYFNFIEQAQGFYSWGGGDAIAAYAADNGMHMHCHNLAGPNIYTPDWVVNGKFTSDKLKQILVTHIQTVVGHFKGKCESWDVVNEGLNTDGSVDTSNDNVWGNTIGASYIDLAFQTARQADPGAKLFYNDNHWNLTSNADNLATFVKGLQQRGVPIDGVGLQCHWTPSDSYPGATLDQATMEADIAGFAKLGLLVRMSELDARVKTPATSAALAEQTTMFDSTVQACLYSPNCINITNWEADDDFFWTAPSYNQGYGLPSMFTAGLNPKPVYTSVMNELRTAALASSTAPKLTAPAIMNAADYANAGVAPGEVITLYPANAGPAALTTTALDATGKVETEIAGTRVLFDGIAAPLVYAVKGQLAAVVPYEIAGQTATQAQVEYNGIRSVAVTIPVLAAVPGLFTVNQQGTGEVAAWNQDNTVNSASNPAARGSYVQIWATGEGQRNPAGLTGVPAPAYDAPVLPVTVTLGGVEAKLAYAAASPGFIGLMQINLIVPDTAPAGSAVPLVVKVGTAQSPAGVTIALK